MGILHKFKTSAFVKIFESEVLIILIKCFNINIIYNFDPLNMVCELHSEGIMNLIKEVD